jgi:hypothetical protein
MRDDAPTPDAGSGGGEQPQQQQIVVNDPEDFAKTRQLKSIFDARDDFIESREVVEELKQPKAAVHIFRHLQDFLLATEPLLRSTETGKEILEERTYSTDTRFVAKRDLCSFNEAKRVLKESARDELGGELTTAKLTRVLRGFGLDLAASEVKKVLKNHQSEQAPKPDGGVSVDATAAESVFAGHSSDPKRMNLKRLQADIQQLSQPDDDDPATAANVDALMDLVFEVRQEVSPGSRRKLEHRAREAATDWGWEINGAEHLLGEKPKLAYRKKHANKFGTTTPPPWVSNSVFVDIQGVISDLGLGVSFSEEQQTKIDSDLLTEVDQWRQENVE